MPSRLSLQLVIACVLATFVLWLGHDFVVTKYARGDYFDPFGLIELKLAFYCFAKWFVLIHSLLAIAFYVVQSVYRL